MEKHVRARCTTTGAIAAISERALRLGMFPAWVRVKGSKPKRPKPRVQIGAKQVSNADDESASNKKE